MAHNEDTAALVAAQLTAAWATIYATKEGVFGLPDTTIETKVGEVYKRYLKFAKLA